MSLNLASASMHLRVQVLERGRYPHVWTTRTIENSLSPAPGCSYQNQKEEEDLSTLNSIYSARLSASQVKLIYELSDNIVNDSSDCLLDGPSTTSVLNLMMKRASSKCPVIKLPVDEDDAWSDIVSFYKNMPSSIGGSCLRIRLLNKPPIDVCVVSFSLLSVRRFC